MQEKVTGDKKLKEFRSKAILAFFRTMIVSRMEMNDIILVIKFSVPERKLRFNRKTAVKERR